MQRRNRTIPLLLTAALGLGAGIAASAVPAQARDGAASSGAQTAAERAAARVAPTSIAFHPCSDASLKSAGAVCGYLSVPLDWSKPTGTKIKIAVSKVAHTVRASKYQGIMLVNPGGPGGSGLGLATIGQDVPNHAGDAYDWIGFDPRGVGESKPELSCIPKYSAGPRPEYIPSTSALEKVWLARTKRYDSACAKSAGSVLLDHMTTQDVARDMDYLRASLHRSTLNYYGFSYGTYLGQVYSTLFPHHVRRMVLDSTVDPRGVWYKANLAQDIAFEKTENIWFGWVAKYDSVYHLGKTAADVRATWYAEKRAVARKPIAGVVGPDEWTDIFLNAGYYQLVWLQLGDLFATVVHKKSHYVTKLVGAYRDYVGPSNDNEFAVYNGVQCTDTKWPSSFSTWRTDNWRVFSKAPFETWGNVWFNAPCLYWPGAAHTPVKIDGSQVKSVLMIDETLDAATPFGGSLYVRSLYPGARLIAEPGGTTHAGTLYGNACVDDQIAAYIAHGTLPKRRSGTGPDTTCRPLPQPDPSTKGNSLQVVAARSRIAAVSTPVARVP